VLTERQRQCLRGVLELKTAKEIGRELGLTHHMIEQHLKAARETLGAQDSRDAARIFASLEPKVEPYYGSPEVSEPTGQELEPSGRIPAHDSSTFTLRESAGESKGIVYQFSAIQTVGAILLVSVGLVVTLALLIAVAQGFAALLS
jgi:DNA-binding CsgD family transcriptional regulator